MVEFLQFTLSGVVFGMIYAAVALSLVLIWRGTRLLNYAQGGMAMFTTYVAIEVIYHTGSYWAGFVVALASGMGLSDILLHAGAGAGVLAVAFVCFAMGWVGGGDAKVAAGAALWFGFAHLLNYLLYASLFGGALTLLLLQFRQWPLPQALGGQAWLLRLHDKETGIPYGIALAVGALLIYPETDWIRAVDLTRFAIT